MPKKVVFGAARCFVFNLFQSAKAAAQAALSSLVVVGVGPASAAGADDATSEASSAGVLERAVGNATGRLEDATGAAGAGDALLEGALVVSSTVIEARQTGHCAACTMSHTLYTDSCILFSHLPSASFPTTTA